MPKTSKTKTVKTEVQQPQSEIILQKPLDRDDIVFQKLMQNFSKLAKYIYKDLNNNKDSLYTFSKSFKKEEVLKWISSPARYEKQLRNLSRFLYNSSSHYKRLLKYFAYMPTFDYVIELKGVSDFSALKPDVVEKKYLETCNFLENMNIKQEFQKVNIRAWIDDVAYFYEYKTNVSYFLNELDPDYCQINAIEDGCYNFSFDFSYFNKYPEKLEIFGGEFVEKYNLYKTDTKNFKWQELDSKHTLCIKICETDYPVPPMVCLFPCLYDLEDIKMLQKSRIELENYLILVAKIPYLNNKDTANNFALTLDKALEYFQMMSGELPDQIGSILSPFEEISSVKLERQDRERDNVTSAEAQLFSEAGVSQLLFSNNSAAGAALSAGIRTDEDVAFAIVRQYERWLNRKLKDFCKIIYFKIEILNISEHNRKDVIAYLKESATLGAPNKLRYCAALGMTPASVIHMLYLENDVLKIIDRFKPLQSAYQTGNNGAGREEIDDDELSPEGQTTRERGDNDKENRDY